LWDAAAAIVNVHFATSLVWCVLLVLQLSKGLKRRVEKTKQKLAGSAADVEFDQHKENFEDQQHDAKRLFKEAERQAVFAPQHCLRLHNIVPRLRFYLLVEQCAVLLRLGCFLLLRCSTCAVPLPAAGGSPSSFPMVKMLLPQM
jgi:hypothetical protein